MSDSLRLCGLQPARLLCPWNSPGKKTGVGCHFFTQGIFPTQRQNLGLLHCRQILYHLSHQESHNNLGLCLIIKHINTPILIKTTTHNIKIKVRRRKLHNYYAYFSLSIVFCIACNFYNENAPVKYLCFLLNKA